MRKLLLVAIACCFVAAPASASAGPPETPGAGMIALDILVARPVSPCVATASTGVFAGTLALTWLTGISHDAAYILVAAPWRYTAARIAGDFKHYKDGRNIYGFTTETPAQKRARVRAVGS